MSIPLLSQLSDLAPIGIAVVVAAAVWFFLLRVRPTKLKSADDVKNVIGGGKPVVLEFFSNMWGTCLLAKPIVNGIEKDLEGRAKVFRLNLLSAIGKEIASQYSVTAVPTTMAFDMDGKLVYQHAGVPSRKAVVDRLKS